MYSLDFRIPSNSDGMMIAATRWGTPATAKAVVVIAHGMGEHMARYTRFAAALTDAHYLVYALDHRGHGQSVPVGQAPGDFGKGGWAGLVGDIISLIVIAKEENPGLKTILFGHSMGSFAAQQVAVKISKDLDALVLCGSAAQDQLIEARIKDMEENPLESLGAADARTPFDWLSRDEAEVDKYIEDPLCGFALSDDSMASGMEAAFEVGKADVLKEVRSDLPVLFMAGTEDPVNGDMVFLETLESRWKEAGVANIEKHYYKGARHEVLNETNRHEVTKATIQWMDGVV